MIINIVIGMCIIVMDMCIVAIDMSIVVIGMSIVIIGIDFIDDYIVVEYNNMVALLLLQLFLFIDLCKFMGIICLICVYLQNALNI